MTYKIWALNKGVVWLIIQEGYNIIESFTFFYRAERNLSILYYLFLSAIIPTSWLQATFFSGSWLGDWTLVNYLGEG